MRPHEESAEILPNRQRTNPPPPLKKNNGTKEGKPQGGGGVSHQLSRKD